MLKASRVLLAVLAALGMSSALAQTGPAVGGFNTTTSGNTTSHTYKSDGAPDLARLMRRPFVPGGGDTTDFEVLMNKKGYTPKGSEYNYKVTKPVPKFAFSKALAKTLPVVGNLYAMAELLETLYPDEAVSWDNTTQQWQKDSTQQNWGWGTDLPWRYGYASPNLGCQAFQSWWNGANPEHPSYMEHLGSVPDGPDRHTCRVNERRRATGEIHEGPRNFGFVNLYGTVPGPKENITQQALEDKLNATSPLPFEVDPLLDQIPPAAKDELADAIEADPTPPRAVPTSPAGVESPSGWTVPESITTRYTNDAANRPQTITSTTQTVVRTLPSGQLQHDTTTTTTTTTQTGTNPDGSPITETTTETETTTTTPAPPPGTDPATPPPNQEIITCGLPDTPPCKIDETGTPEADPANTQAEIDSLFADIKTCLQDIRACLPTLPDLSWSFALPTGCAPLYFDTLVGVVIPIDMCEHQPMIHDLMTMVWAAAGLFGAIAMVGRFSSGA